MSESPHIHIIRNPRFESELEELKAPLKSKAEVEHALDFALERDPGRGFPVAGGPYRVWPVYLKGREYVVYYRLEASSDGQTIYLDSIQPGPET